MSKEEQQGTITEKLPNVRFRVMLEGGREVMCYISGRMRLNNIKIVIGDKVLVVTDPYKGTDTNRIVRRL